MTAFKPPKGQRICLQYFHSLPDGTRQTLAIVTESYPIPDHFSLYLFNGKSWQKHFTKQEPDFDSEVLPIYETKR